MTKDEQEAINRGVADINKTMYGSMMVHVWIGLAFVICLLIALAILFFSGKV